jgi:hypothetical protein
VLQDQEAWVVAIHPILIESCSVSIGRELEDGIQMVWSFE